MKEPSPLLLVLRGCTVPQQHRLAELAGTKRNYLYQLAGKSRSPNVALAVAISGASRILHQETNGKTPIITVEQFATR